MGRGVHSFTYSLLLSSLHLLILLRRLLLNPWVVIRKLTIECSLGDGLLLQLCLLLLISRSIAGRLAVEHLSLLLRNPGLLLLHGSLVIEGLLLGRLRSHLGRPLLLLLGRGELIRVTSHLNVSHLVYTSVGGSLVPASCSVHCGTDITGLVPLIMVYCVLEL